MRKFLPFWDISPLRFFCLMLPAVLMGCDMPTLQRDTAPISRAKGLMANTSFDGESCILDREFGLNQVFMDSPEVVVINLLGEPLERPPIDPNSDIPVNSIVYPGLNVYLFNNQVAELTATDPVWETPSGLRVGLTEEELFVILGQVPDRARYRSQVVYEIPYCNGGAPYDLGWAFLLFMDDNGRVMRLDIQRDWP